MNEQEAEIKRLKKKIKGLEGSIENWYKPWERDALVAISL